MQRCVDAKMQSLLRNILISPLEGEKKFLSELCELRNFREGYDLKYSCPVQHETVLEPSPAFVMLTGVRKRLLPLTKREGCDSVISSDFKSKISITNENNLSCKDLSYFGRSALLCRQGKELSVLVPQYLSNFSETFFSRFTSHFSLKRKVAFTLAEVLITLGIIGIVAAITLPSLIQNYQKKETVAKLKRVYSVLQQATLSAQNDYGEVNDWDFSDAYEFGQKYYVPYLKTIQNYNKTTTYNYTDLAGELHSSKAILFVLADGTFVHILLRPEYQVPFHILVDLNGKRGPNILGRDLFAFSYYNGKLNTYNQYQEKWSTTRYSVSLAGTSGQCNRKAKGGVFGVGSYCSTLIMLDGWEISSDYPW